MKLTLRAILLALIGATSAAPASDAIVYLFQGQEWASTPNPPTLSPEEARLVFAQRLGVSHYHGVGDVSQSTLLHINAFGGCQGSIFQNLGRDKVPELVLFVQGASARSAERFTSAWSSVKPAFAISDTPSSRANLRLIEDFHRQIGQGKACAIEQDINPFDQGCWNGKTSKAIFMDLKLVDHTALTELMVVQERLTDFAKNNEMNVMVVLMPDNSYEKKSKSYGSYDMPSRVPLDRRQAEESITGLLAATSTGVNSKEVTSFNTSAPFEPITGVPRLCHSSLDMCMISTNNCSGRGECYLKYGRLLEDGTKSQECYTCGCVPTEEEVLKGKDGEAVFRTTYWGGAACQKKDVSGPFWLFAIFTVVMIGLVSWSIGLLFSIGEEQLPGVIGAGVPTKSR